MTRLGSIKVLVTNGVNVLVTVEGLSVVVVGVIEVNAVLVVVVVIGWITVDVSTVVINLIEMDG